MTQSQERDLRHRVNEARRLLEEPLLNEALDLIEKAAVEDMIRVPFWNARRMRMIADRIRVIRSIRGHLQHVIVNGEQALKVPLRLA